LGGEKSGPENDGGERRLKVYAPAVGDGGLAAHSTDTADAAGDRLPPPSRSSSASSTTVRTSAAAMRGPRRPSTGPDRIHRCSGPVTSAERRAEVRRLDGRAVVHRDHAREATPVGAPRVERDVARHFHGRPRLNRGPLAGVEGVSGRRAVPRHGPGDGLATGRAASTLPGPDVASPHPSPPSHRPCQP
jgi:hypothetical protein